MEMKIKVKEEVSLSDTDSHNDTQFSSVDHTVTIKNDITIRSNDCEEYTKMEIKLEPSFSYCSQEEGEFIFKDSIKKLKSDTVSCSMGCEIDSEIEIKEEAPPDFYSGFEMEICSENPELNAKKYNTDYKMEFKDSGWLEKTSPEAPSVYDETKDGMVEDLSPAELPRLYTEAASSSSSAPSDLLNIESLQKIDNLKLRKEGFKFFRPNTGESCETGNMETYCLQQSANHHKLTKLHEHLTTEGLNKSGDNAKKLHICNICERSFTHRKYLKRHILYHEGKKPHKCDLCEWSFTESRSLKRHILIHEGKRPYKCNACGKRFTHSGTLKTHMFIHEGKRPYTCDVCDKSFTQRGSLKAHILIHEGKKPHKCTVCERTFIGRGHLKTHILIHEGRKPYKCDVCERDFTQKGNLKKHILIHESKKSHQ